MKKKLHTAHIYVKRIRCERIYMDRKLASSCEVREPGNWRHHGCAMPSHPILQKGGVGSKTCVSTPRFGHWDHGGTGACPKVDAAPAPWQTCWRLRSQAKPADATPIHPPTPATAFFMCRSLPGNSNKRASAIAKKLQNAITKSNRNMHDHRKELSPPLFGVFLPYLREDHN